MQINTQPQEGLDLREDGSLEVVDTWLTIQGEGPYQGLPAVFVRLASCNLQCPLCDTDYTSRRTRRTAADIFASVEDLSSGQERPLIVLTGGEPLRQNIAPFVLQAVSYDFRVQIETNGTLGVPRELRLDSVKVVCSPKTPKIHTGIQVDAFKYVLQDGFVDPEDGLPLSVLGMPWKVARPPANFKRSQIYVQPLDQQNRELNVRNEAVCVESSFAYGYRLCLQIHKILGLE